MTEKKPALLSDLLSIQGDVGHDHDGHDDHEYNHNHGDKEIVIMIIIIITNVIMVTTFDPLVNSR